MAECDDCGSEVQQVWRHRAFECETRRTLRWICRSCHPDLPERRPDDRSGARSATGSSGADTSPSTDAVELRSDGGRPTSGVTISFASKATERSRCPVCLSDTTGEGSSLRCRECRWSGPG